MSYAEVAVNFPGSRSTFCYTIPPQLKVNVGQAVWVPFGSTILQGIVVQLEKQPSFEIVKEIADVISEYPLLPPERIELALWISEHYHSSLFSSLALMLPPGVERGLVTYFREAGNKQDLSSLSTEQRQVLQAIRERRKLGLREVERLVGKKKAKLIINQLLSSHVISKARELQQAKVKPKTVPYVKLIITPEKLEEEKACLNRARARKQAALLDFLSRQRCPTSFEKLRKNLNCSYGTIKALESRHLISIERSPVRRDPLAYLASNLTPSPLLTPSQQAAWESIEQKLEKGNEGSPPIFLLFGVTGSGKTEIYLKALEKVIAMGKRGICLVPEIALTPQAVERFYRRFPGRVAMLHSGLSLGEQFDEWQWIREGNCDVVIGPRSALFAPQPNLGLIIIDEEHEWTYKQEDKAPRYHARNVAVKLAQLTGAALILGSATPDIESFHKAQLGQYQLVELKERITPQGYSPLPEVSIVDMKEELKAGNRSLFSRRLIASMKESLIQDEQIILFLNRRGTFTLIQCRSCGFVYKCPRCSIALTYHKAEKRLICHRCHYRLPIPQTCPQCSSRSFKLLGIGTQRVEEELRELLPQAKLLRWDRDVTARRHAHEELLAIFRDHKADILIGTQMVAKGLHLPQVTLVGIINADIGLNFPDFRAGERCFQLLCQVAGRAGRGLKAGTVIIQTYTPENYAIQAAASYDYSGFYNQEIEYRRQFNYPPFSQLIRLIYTHTNEVLCHREVERVSHLLQRALAHANPDSTLIGPTPAFTYRVRGKYRWQIIIRGQVSSKLIQALSGISLPQGWIIDVDPVGVA